HRVGQLQAGVVRGTILLPDLPSPDQARSQPARAGCRGAARPRNEGREHALPGNEKGLGLFLDLVLVRHTAAPSVEARTYQALASSPDISISIVWAMHEPKSTRCW